ncbi:MAG: 23S rRNA (guanosine(2251)-2'-O)-methyltransferase RlmB [Flavobacteriales bacterium]|nr:23S rRNA (guanosine(2251)-2'-O)-methyltransferase RlmB [Flavobacteriales bacterium]|tara:strand:- start:32115 stop:32849 length:735 start_codon:yes stop_codon:yes gene_type:complete
MANENYIFGMHPVMEAIKANKEIDKVFIQSDLRGPHVTELRKLLKTHKVSSQNLPLGRMNHLYKKNHQGVVAFLSPIDYQPYQEVISNAFESGKMPLVLILDRVSDVGNFGAICRTAECTGVDCIIIPVKGSAQINGEAVKRSSGALLNVNISKERDLAAVAEDLKSMGLQVVGCTEKTEDLIYSVDYKMPTAIVMGSEEDGINSQLMKTLDAKVKIPMIGNTESLNVSVSAGVIIYEAIRQRI